MGNKEQFRSITEFFLNKIHMNPRLRLSDKVSDFFLFFLPICVSCRLQSNLMVNGIAEPLIQFRTSLDASNEEINCFNAMVQRILPFLPLLTADYVCIEDIKTFNLRIYRKCFFCSCLLQTVSIEDIKIFNSMVHRKCRFILQKFCATLV